MKLIFLSFFLSLISCQSPAVKFQSVFRKDRGSNLTVLFFGPHEGTVTRAAKGYSVGQFSDQWEPANDSSVWTEPNWNVQK